LRPTPTATPSKDAIAGCADFSRCSPSRYSRTWGDLASGSARPRVCRARCGIDLGGRFYQEREARRSSAELTAAAGALVDKLPSTHTKAYVIWVAIAALELGGIAGYAYWQNGPAVTHAPTPVTSTIPVQACLVGSWNVITVGQWYDGSLGSWQLAFEKGGQHRWAFDASGHAIRRSVLVKAWARLPGRRTPRSTGTLPATEIHCA
jgi:hypothetical protein